MTWAAAAAATAAVVGGVMKSKSAKKSGKRASKGAQAEMDLIRESRDMVRADTKHTRQAGATALNALMSMTGLAGGGGVKYDENGWPAENPGGTQPGSALAPPPEQEVVPQARQSAYGGQFDTPEDPRYNPRDNNYFDQPRIRGAYRGADMGGGDTLFNINEMGPENVYSGGSMNRNPNPMTIGGQGGYVQPNKGPQNQVPPTSGGYQDQVGWGGPQNMIPPPGQAIRQQNMFRGRDANQPTGNRQMGGGQQGFRQPNIEGRGLGGFLKKAAGFALSPTLGMAGYKKGQEKEDAARAAANAAPAPEEEPIGTDIDTTQGQDYNFQTDPGYQFRFEEGQRALDRGAAARGGLLSGGYARKAMRYGQGFASNEYTNVYNRISNIAGMGQVANQSAGGATMQAGAGMGNAAANKGYAGAYASQMQGNAITEGINDIDWGTMFNRGK